MPKGQPRRSMRQQIADSQQATQLRANGLYYHQIADVLGVSRNTAARLVHWAEDTLAAYGHFPRDRRKRLSFRHGTGWDEQRFQELVAARQKALETLNGHEALDNAERVVRSQQRAERDSIKAKRDEGAEWIERGSSPESTPAWLKDALDG